MAGEDQLERLIAAIEANTQAQLEMAKAVTDMADQSAALIDLMANTGVDDGGGTTALPELDLAGRPVG